MAIGLTQWIGYQKTGSFLTLHYANLWACLPIVGFLYAARMSVPMRPILYDPSHPAAFGRVAAKRWAANRDKRNISNKEFVRWLEKRHVYTLHKPLRKRIKKIASGIGS